MSYAHRHGADGSLLSALCDDLSLQGCVVVEASQHEADVLMTASDLEAATKLPLGERADRALASDTDKQCSARRQHLSVSPSS